MDPDLLCEMLNERGIVPVIKNGKIVRLEKCSEEAEAPVPLTDEEYEELELDKEYLGYLQPHPEGSDRGGYRPEINSFQYDENGGEWQ